MNKSTVIMLGLLVFAVLGGPAIFYGLFAMNEAGAFDNPLDDFWILAAGLIAFIVLVWTALLYIGSRAIAADKNREPFDG